MMRMSNSALVSHVNMSPNSNSPRNHAIDTITIHCVVGQCSVETLGNIFAPASRQASSNYGVGTDGRIGMYVEERDRSWCSSSAANDNRAVTIEVASDTSAPYAVNDKAYAALIDLVTDICRRNGIKKLFWRGDSSLIGQTDKQNMTVHRWFANKSCPGDYLYARHGAIADEVNRRLGSSGASSPSPAPSKPSGKSADELAREVIAGKWGNGEDRKARLTAAGYNYAEVQARVNAILSSNTSVPAPAPAPASPAPADSLYRVRKAWPDAKTQKGAFSSLANAKKCADANSGYSVFDESGTKVYGGTADTAYDTYTVVKGDSLWSIAAKRLGNGARYTEIKVLNGLKSDLIHAGDKLKIPAK
jgi:LysM repeat protein